MTISSLPAHLGHFAGMGSSYQVKKVSLRGGPEVGSLTFSDVYESEMRRLAEALPPEIPATIDHIGSTAVKGLPAVPTLDLVVEVNSSDVKNPCLLGTGYVLAMRADLGHPVWLLNRILPGKDAPPLLLSVVHVVGPNDLFKKRALQVRDTLRTQEKWHTYYASMRASLLEKCPECYRPCKGQFFAYLAAFFTPTQERTGHES